MCVHFCECVCVFVCALVRVCVFLSMCECLCVFMHVRSACASEWYSSHLPGPINHSIPFMPLISGVPRRPGV